MPQIKAKARTDPWICHIIWMLKIKMAWFLTKLTVQEINTRIRIIIRLQVFSRCCYYLEEWLVWTHSWFNLILIDWKAYDLKDCYKLEEETSKLVHFKHQNWSFSVWIYERSFRNFMGNDITVNSRISVNICMRHSFSVCANLRGFELTK